MEKKKGTCPLLDTCRASVTRYHFEVICNASAYHRCHHYAVKSGGLKPPFEWLQNLAIAKHRAEGGIEQRQART